MIAISYLHQTYRTVRLDEPTATVSDVYSNTLQASQGMSAEYVLVKQYSKIRRIWGSSFLVLTTSQLNAFNEPTTQVKGSKANFNHQGNSIKMHSA